MVSRFQLQKSFWCHSIYLPSRLVDQRFSRLESHVITLARSVAHLSAELRSQNKIRQNIATLQKEVYELTMRRNNELKYLQERVHIVDLDRMTQKRIRKLRKYVFWDFFVLYFWKYYFLKSFFYLLSYLISFKVLWRWPRPAITFEVSWKYWIRSKCNVVCFQ